MQISIKVQYILTIIVLCLQISICNLHKKVSVTYLINYETKAGDHQSTHGISLFINVIPLF